MIPPLRFKEFCVEGKLCSCPSKLSFLWFLRTGIRWCTFALHVPYICLASDNIVKDNFEKCSCWNNFYEIQKIYRYVYNVMCRSKITYSWPRPNFNAWFPCGIFFLILLLMLFLRAESIVWIKQTKPAGCQDDSLSTIISIIEINVEFPQKIKIIRAIFCCCCFLVLLSCCKVFLPKKNIVIWSLFIYYMLCEGTRVYSSSWRARFLSKHN